MDKPPAPLLPAPKNVFASKQDSCGRRKNGQWMEKKKKSEGGMRGEGRKIKELNETSRNVKCLKPVKEATIFYLLPPSFPPIFLLSLSLYLLSTFFRRGGGGGNMQET